MKGFMKNPASFEAVSKPQGEEEKLDIQGLSQELERRIGDLDRHQQIRAKKWLAKVRRKHIMYSKSLMSIFVDITASSRAL